ncbi:hypothetical protein [Aestuariivita sp.]|jgi:hypothetical protein|uniref:hypothetical protein n=1 Tax=Aestuariivita sp. TaxID=1872407 RepID=UPI00216D961C|nr:hypothetical protein [Aestuariivita sp.]MCE8008854.1 hypothetical protein [Aestuariivita sp.]
MRLICCLALLALPGCDLARSILPGPADAPGQQTVAPAMPEPDGENDAVTDAAAGSNLPNAALPPPVGQGSTLGMTVASLGDPAQGGMWLKTPLVRSERPGQVRYRGSVVAVTLQPLDLPVGSGSQISLRAMQALGASLTDLVEVTVEAT